MRVLSHTGGADSAHCWLVITLQWAFSFKCSSEYLVCAQLRFETFLNVSDCTSIEDGRCLLLLRNRRCLKITWHIWTKNGRVFLWLPLLHATRSRFHWSYLWPSLFWFFENGHKFLSTFFARCFLSSSDRIFTSLVAFRASSRIFDQNCSSTTNIC